MWGMIGMISKLHLCSDLKVVERQWGISIGSLMFTNLERLSVVDSIQVGEGVA
jgi:hypothetical protein